MFLPQAGCPGRCLFCAQEKQSGTPVRALSRQLADLEAAFARRTPDTPVELAFYGGTFTALPDGFSLRFLELAARLKDQGLVTGVRCSTRPDAASPETLARLARAGLTGVEFGVQTFTDRALELVRRGHTGQDARQACDAARQAGLGLGVHLMPGMPGHTPDDLLADVDQVVACKAGFVRLSPCLVLEGTGLEAVWRRGGYEPWSLEQCLAVLPGAVLALWRAGVGVARIGLAPEPDLLAARLAGPWHPALGMRVTARALLAHAAELLGGRKARRIEVPARLRGGFFGHAGELVPAWAELGLTKDTIAFVQGERFAMTVEPCAA